MSMFDFRDGFLYLIFILPPENLNHMSIFAGLSICATGLDAEAKVCIFLIINPQSISLFPWCNINYLCQGEIMEITGEMGGLYCRNFSESVTHLVANVVSTLKYQTAIKSGVHVVLPQWVKVCSY